MRQYQLIKRSITVFDVPSHKTPWLRKIQFASINSLEAESRESSSVTDSSGRGEVVDADPLVLYDRKLQFKRDAGCISSVRVVWQ